MKNRVELSFEEIERVKNKIVSVLMKYPEISFAYLHGSFGVHPFRDIDIAAYCLIPEDKVFEFELELISELEKKTGFNVDFKVINFAPIGFQFSVINEGTLLFEREREQRLDFIEKLGAEYMEYYEFSKSYFRELIECIKK